MIATLTFDLDDPEDQDRHVRAVKADRAYIVLWNIKNNFRNALKYGDHDEVTYTAIEKLQEELFEELYSNGINLDDELE